MNESPLPIRPPDKRHAIAISWFIAALLAVVTVLYRGFSQSVTIDEAFAYHLFLNQSASVLVERFDAAYHVLHTWASWIAVHKFGKSEPILRLASMVSGIAYLAGVVVLCRLVAGNGWRLVLSVLLLSVHPLIADYLSAARGYGSSLAFFVWAVISILKDRLSFAALLMALSVACNLTFLTPCVALALATAILGRLQRSVKILSLLRPAIVFAATTVGILALPLRNARREHFYYGAEDWTTSLYTLLASSFHYGDRFNRLWESNLLQYVAAIAGVLICVLCGFAAVQRAFFAPLICLTLFLNWIFLVAAHRIWGVLYPWSRTGLSLIFLYLLALVCCWGWLGQAGKALRPLYLAFGLYVFLLAGIFIAQFDTRYYYDFREDADVRELMRRVQTSSILAKDACIGGSWRFEPTVNYYRLRYRIDWLKEMQRTEKPILGCTFYILASDDAKYISELDLIEVQRGTISGTVLAQDRISTYR